MVSIPHPLRGPAGPIPWSGPGTGTTWWVLAACLILGLSAMLPVLQKSTATSRGFTLQHHQADRDRLNNEIRLLESEVARLTSQDRIERRALQIGLQPPAGGAMYLEVDEPGPEPAKIPAEFLPPPPAAVERPASGWRSLLEWLPIPN